MTTSAPNPSTWEEIERSESYLVSCMFEEATSLASSIIKNLCDNYCEIGRNDELDDMLEAAAMVLVQSMKELGMTSGMLKELKLLFGSVTKIPSQVFVTGVCFQISEDPFSGVQEYLEEFLSKWIYREGGDYFSVEDSVSNWEGFGKHFSLGVDKYLEVVELYAITFLGILRKDIDLAISWTEKAALPEEKRQELLRRLHSMNAPNATSSSQASFSSLHVDKHGLGSVSLEEQKTHSKLAKDLEAGYLANRENSMKETILELSRKKAPCFWWFRNFTLKFGNTKLVLSTGNVLLGCLLLFICYFVRRKRATLKRILRKQALSIKKALVDLWQLAFSYQVNPLAAVQPLAAATHASV